MKQKFSLNELLHRDRLMIIFSLVVALTAWAVVSFGPGNVQTRTITATVKVDLTDTSAGYNDLRVIGEDTFTVNVVVEGTRSVIFNLASDDLEIKPSLTDIQGPGKSDVSLNVNKAGKSTGYTINSISPSTVTVECDYWNSASFAVSPDVSLLTVEDEKAQQIGDVLLDTAALSDGRVSIEGPRTVVRQINSVVARVEEAQTLSKTAHLQARLLALNESGGEVDVSQCQFTGLSDSLVDVTVPVWVQRTVDLTYTLANVPSGLSQNGLVTLSHNSITLVGEEETLTSVAGTIGNLGVFDFDHIRPETAEMTVQLTIPNGVKVLEGDSVTVSLPIDKFSTRTLSYSVRSLDDVIVDNLPDGKTITLQEQKLTDIVVCGTAATLRRLTANDLNITLDASSNTGSGSVRYTVRITVPEHPDVWVYYGADDNAAYKLYGTLK